MNGRRAFLALSLGLFAWGAVLRGGETLVVATYNIENYGPANRMTEAGYRMLRV